ncbi:hypothetical protein SmJEL517_g03376 [Synchytrium microbalum]|uniref:Enoyl reductase (ER) domain-containing protein n=1 Tax=Synchytrium microbalum TaxID=1806994 RepID=A0A507C339_9FUNG|nr:uncharacterized protein SmJEL517_g03376 [Synchytrium microbalum]TPX33861.1 hypothetical protein SmJEL517_g03376 [Synchytrium microbalum]
MKAAMVTKASIEDGIEVQTVDKPVPAKGEVLVQVTASAINPVDWKLVKYGAYKSYPGPLGCDFAGVVTALGDDVKDFAVGDEVMGFTRLMEAGRGTFAQFLVAEASCCIRKPASMPFDEASTFGVGSLTAALALFFHQKLAKPSTSPKDQGYYLVWGASSSVGLFAVQLAKAAGFQVIGTCSPRNFDLVKSFGADFVLDSNKETALLGEIDNIIKDVELKYALDCIGADTALHCAIALASGGILCTIAGEPKSSPEDIEVIPTLLGGYEKDVKKKRFVEDFILNDLNSFLLKKGLIKGNPTQILDGGLSAVKEGFELSSTGKVSGKKLVLLQHT